MKNKKLKLKHLAHYIPHKVYLMNSYGSSHNTTLHECLSIQDMLEMKLVLRPLSNLIEEVEHNGEKFIPMDKLISSLKYGDKYKSTLYWEKIKHYKKEDKESFNTELIFTIRNKALLDSTSIWIYNKLLEWHFDIFDLIGKNLAIKKG